MGEFQQFLHKLWTEVSPVLAGAWAGICWVMFPDAAYYPAAIAVGLAVVLDMATKLFALAKNNNGYRKAVEAKIILSDTLFKRTIVKLYAYTVIFILAGLSIRVSILKEIGIFIATVVYAFIFIRECQSNIENLMEAGADGLKPLLFWLKKKEQSIIENDKNGEE